MRTNDLAGLPPTEPGAGLATGSEGGACRRPHVCDPGVIGNAAARANLVSVLQRPRAHLLWCGRVVGTVRSDVGDLFLSGLDVAEKHFKDGGWNDACSDLLSLKKFAALEGGICNEQ